jgi:hypothetical protein
VWIFFIFWSSKIHISPIDVVSFLSPPRYRLTSGRRRHADAPCHASFPWSQDELTAFASSSGNVSPRTTVASHTPRTARLPPSTDIKISSQPSHSLHHSTTSSFCLLPSQTTTPLELHPPPSFFFHCYSMFIIPSHNDTYSDELADPLSLSEQLINMWIHVKNILKSHIITQAYQLVY